MKALEMLYRDKKWIEEECDISKIPIERVQTMIIDLVEINEAIAELEALQQRSCDGCKTLPFVLTELAKKNGGKCGTCKRYVKDNYEAEPKDNA